MLIIVSPLERGRGVLAYIHMCVRKPIFVDVFHTPPYPSREGRIYFVSACQRTKGEKETPATTCFVITGAKVGGGKHTWNFLWCGWYKLVGEWSKLFSKWCSAVTSIPLSLLVLATGKGLFCVCRGRRCRICVYKPVYISWFSGFCVFNVNLPGLIA